MAAEKPLVPAESQEAGETREDPSARPRVIVAFGDSITKGVRPGVSAEQTFCAVLEQRLKAKGANVRVINAGVGGHSTRDGRKRFEEDVLARRPDEVILFFGANDASLVHPGPEVRNEPRIPLAEYRENLTYFVKRCQAAGARVVLCTPTPMTPIYPWAKIGAYNGQDINFVLVQFAEAARQVARETKVVSVDLYRLFLDRPEWLKLFPDGIHPNAAGHQRIAEALLKAFE